MTALDGMRVAVTRSPDQAAELCDRLRARGAVPVPFPTIAIEPIDPSAGLDEALHNLERYAWVVFTSANGVRFVLERREHLGHGPWPHRVRVAAVGSVTGRSLERRGLLVDAIPDEFRGDAIPAVLDDLAGQRVLLPRADIGRKAIVAGLTARGATIDDLPVYRTVTAAPGRAARDRLRAGIDAVTFTSPSTLRGFLEVLGAEGRELLERHVVASIGPVTTEAAHAEGIRVDVQAEPHTIEGLVEALARFMEVSA